MQNKLRPACILSAIVAVLAAVASAGGFLIPGLYRDNAFVKAAWHADDLMALVIAIPLLLIGREFSLRGSLRWRLVWLGMLDYVLYNYAFYLFGAAFNKFFLIYVALFALSIYALIFGLVPLNADEIGRRFRDRTPVKLIAGYMIFVAVGLTTVYVAQTMGFILHSQLPPIVIRTGHPTSVVFALDLSLVVPGMVLGAVWLWNRRPWGYVLAAILILKGVVYTLGLVVASVFAAHSGIPEAASEIPLWLTLSVLGLIAYLLLMLNLSEREVPPQ